MIKSASITGSYRHNLIRNWGDGKVCAFIMLNPSTADYRTDDPTIRKCVGFAKLWGMSSIVVVNLFQYRSTSPSELHKVEDPIGPNADEIILDYVRTSDLIVCAWGNYGSIKGRSTEVINLLSKEGKTVYHLGLTKQGEPRHPLYVSYATQLELLWI